MQIILLVGTKLQVIITKMGLRIQERGEVVKGVPVVQPGDDLFWFNRPRLILYLINFVLFQVYDLSYVFYFFPKFISLCCLLNFLVFTTTLMHVILFHVQLQNAFQLAFFAWTWVRILLFFSCASVLITL